MLPFNAATYPSKYLPSDPVVFSEHKRQMLGMIRCLLFPYLKCDLLIVGLQPSRVGGNLADQYTGFVFFA